MSILPDDVDFDSPYNSDSKRIAELEQQLQGRDAVISGKVKQIEGWKDRITLLEKELAEAKTENAKLNCHIDNFDGENDRLREALQAIIEALPPNYTFAIFARIEGIAKQALKVKT